MAQRMMTACVVALALSNLFGWQIPAAWIVTYGLIQCNDSQPGRLTAEAVDLMENLAATSAHLFQLAMA